MGYNPTNPVYKFKVRDIYEEISPADLNQLERFADKLFSKVGIDVEFTRHFLDRVNDERNKKPISSGELTRLFKQEFKKWGRPIAQMGPDQEAVMKDLQTDINMPFALKWDSKNNELDLVAKTVMRKKDFKTTNKEFPVEGEIIPNPANTIAVNTKSDGDFYGLSKYMGDLSKADKNKFGRSDSAAIISFYDPKELEIVINRIKKYTGLDAKEIAGFVDPGDLKWSVGRMMDCTNFYHKNVVEKKESGEVRNIDPQVIKMFNKARAKFPQAKTDLEAFIKFMQDDHNKDNRAFDQLAKRQTDTEKKIKDLEVKVNKNQKKRLFQSKSTDLLKDIAEAWSKKYKDSINCSNPKGFSQKAHCAGKKKKESVEEVFDPKHGHDSDSHIVKHKDDNDQIFYGVYNGDGKIVRVFYDEDKAKTWTADAHDDLMNDRYVPMGEEPEEEPKGIKIKPKSDKDDEPKSTDVDEAKKCWPGYEKKGTKMMFGKRVNNCVKKEELELEGKRIPRKKGQPANSKKHSDLYTDENPKGTIQGLKFATVADAEASVRKIKSSGKKHAHKIQAAVAMEQRAKAAGKTTAAGVYRKYINAMKKKTNEQGVGIVTKQNATKDVPVGGEYMNVKKIFPGQKRPVPLSSKVKKKDK